MLGVCLTGIGLVKIAEAELGPSHVDEYLALDSLVFLVSCICSYASIRKGSQIAGEKSLVAGLEQIADAFFVIGLAIMTFVSLLFAYEFI
jgi:hypothetical protein